MQRGTRSPEVHGGERRTPGRTRGTLSEWDKLSPGERYLVLFDDPPKSVNRYTEMENIRDFAINESLRLTNQTVDNDGTKQKRHSTCDLGREVRASCV